jgi:D-glycero-D-manno-heptose 1,7-bisphosphate phosphatase
MADAKQKTIFLDRDGTLNEDVDFLSRVEELHVFPFTLPALRLLKDAGFQLVVITNQSGIGRGLYDEAALLEIHKEMQRQVEGLIDGFYFCPHLPDAGCDCRKPKLKMIRDAERDLPIDISRSWLIGDKDLDVLTGEAASMRTALVRTGYGKLFEGKFKRRATITADNVFEAAKMIVGER